MNTYKYGPHSQGRMAWGGRPTPMEDIPATKLTKCGICGTEVSEQMSRFNKPYFTEVRIINGNKVTKRNLFHQCPAAQRQQFQFQVEGIYKLFAQAKQHLKWPKIHLLLPGKQLGFNNYVQPEDELVLSVASAKSRLAGRIMVTDGRKYPGNTFYGSIDTAGVFHQNPCAGPDVLKLLSELSADPAGVAAKFGLLTGRCCFCNKQLEDERSTAVGYGPVCADHYGLLWGAAPAASVAPKGVPLSLPGRVTVGTLWTITDERYITEDSTMKANNITTCSKCGQSPIGEQGLWIPKREDGEIVLWEGTHSCGAKLCIIND